MTRADDWAEHVITLGAAVFVAVGAVGIATGAFEWALVDVGLGVAFSWWDFPALRVATGVLAGASVLLIVRTRPQDDRPRE